MSVRSTSLSEMKEQSSSNMEGQSWVQSESSRDSLNTVYRYCGGLFSIAVIEIYDQKQLRGKGIISS